MTTPTTVEPLSTPDDLFAGLLPRDAQMPADAGNGCPRCDSQLVLSRVYKGREVYPIDSLVVDTVSTGRPDNRTAVVNLEIDALSDEYIEVIEDQVQCRFYGLTCDYRLLHEGVAEIN